MNIALNHPVPLLELDLLRTFVAIVDTGAHRLGIGREPQRPRRLAASGPRRARFHLDQEVLVDQRRQLQPDSCFRSDSEKADFCGSGQNW